MSAALHPGTTAGGLRTRRFLAELGGAPMLGHVGPNWFAAVMGTGIVAVALVGLPFHVPGAETVAAAIWALAAALLLVLTAATALHHRHHPVAARAHRLDPVMANFYGAPAMALMTVGAGALVAGQRWIGTPVALTVAATLWTAGTLLGLLTTVAVPLLLAGQGRRLEDAFGGWLMPVVPPMVSAATGALLIPHLPAGEPQETMLLACYGFFGISLLASLLLVPVLLRRLLSHGAGPAAAVPTWWIVLGPLGQSVTAAHHLGLLAPGILPAPYGTAFESLALVYGIPVWGFAMVWLALAAQLTVRTVRGGMPFGLPWWSFTFPVGTVVTGTSALADVTGLGLLAAAAGVLFAGLVAAWALVATRTVRGVYDGSLLV